MAKLDKTLYRIPRQGRIAGVCAGLADYAEIDVTIMRIIWVIGFFLTGGFLFLVYIIMAVMLPVSETGSSKFKTKKSKSDGPRIDDLELDFNFASKSLRYIGVFLALVGAWLLLGQLLPEYLHINWSYVWPVVLMAFGVLLIIKGRK